MLLVGVVLPFELRIKINHVHVIYIDAGSGNGTENVRP